MLQAAGQPEPQAQRRRVAVRLLQHDTDARYAPARADRRPSRRPRSRGCAPTRRGPGRAERTALDRELLAIPAAEYVRVLAGLEPNRAGKVLCPFHQETDPSLQLYPDGTFYCFGRHSKDRACRKGGTIFDFAAAMWFSGNLRTHREDGIPRAARASGHDVRHHTTTSNGGS